MATFLQLCQETAFDSGTIPGTGQPPTVENQTGRLQRVVGWVRESYDEIQRLSPDWRWMQGEFSGSTVIDVRDYDPAALGITDRFSHWLVHYDLDGGDENSLTIFDPDIGRNDEGFLRVVPYSDFYRTYMRGSAAEETGKPQIASVTPRDRLAVYPLPDKAYTIRGRYQKGLQVLAADDDVPEMPAKYHDMIKWGALMLLGIFDESTNQMQSWGGKYATMKTRLEIEQLPPIMKAGPLG